MKIRDRIKELRRVSAKDLRPNPKNWRTHPKEQADALKGVLADVGIADACIARELPDGTLMLIDGHLRTETLGNEQVPVLVLDVTEEESDKILATLDPLTNMAGLDNSKLEQLLSGIKFENDAIDKMLRELPGIELPETPQAIVEDDVPEPPAKPVTQTGDLWVLGEHRLLCGDSTNEDDVALLMDGKRADLLLTDPPYNVDYVGKTKDALKVTNDSMPDKEFRSFLVSCFSLAFLHMKPGAAFYIWHADSEGFNFRGAVRDCEQKVRQCLIWAKDILVMGRQDYHWQHEPCLYGWKDGASHGWYNDRKQTTLLKFERPSRSAEHPTMKPVAMFAYLVGNSTTPQGLAYDPFLGSGTTLIAAEQLGRKCCGMEISPQYCDVIVKRWETLTGGKAKLCRSGAGKN
jgi:DNA modification methylase